MLPVAVARSSSDNMICTSGFVDDIMFSHNGANTDTGHWRVIHRDSPGGAGAKSAVDDRHVVFVIFSCCVIFQFKINLPR